MRTGRALVALVAVLMLITLELVRASGPLLDRAYSGYGPAAVAGAAVVTYLLPGLVLGLALQLTRRRPAGRLLLPGAVLVALLRLVGQGVDGAVRFTVGLAAVAAAVAVLTLAVGVLAGRPGGGRLAAGAIATGAGAGVGLQLALGTWDAFWRHSVLGWSVTGALVVALLTAAVLAARDVGRPAGHRAGALWALGPFAGLSVLLLANPAFAASQSGVPLALAGSVHAVGLLASGWLVLRSGPAGGQRARWGSAVLLVLLVGAAFGLAELDGGAAWVLVVLLGAQVTAVVLLGAALQPVGTRSGGAVGLAPGDVRRWAGGASLVGLGTIVPALVYQLDYDVPLGFPHELVLVATAALLALRGARVWAARPPGAGNVGSAVPVPWPVLVAGGALVVLGAGVAGAAWFANRPAPADGGTPAGAGSGRVLSWNLHYGVSPGGSVDLETTARTIAAHDPDAVLLQEVSRGWVLGGGVDMATWLSQRLGRQFAFAPAADRQFGNVILSRERPAGVAIEELPYGAGPQDRSALSADVRVGGDVLRVTSVHLQNRAANTATRELQLDTLLADLGPARAAGPARVVGGDLNAGPGSPEVGLLVDAGFVSAVDDVGDPTALTRPSIDPTVRIDWVFGRGVTFTEAAVLADALTSDHLPVVVATTS